MFAYIKESYIVKKYVDLHRKNGRVDVHAIFWTTFLMCILLLFVHFYMQPIKNLDEFRRDSGVLIDITSYGRGRVCENKAHIKKSDGSVIKYDVCGFKNEYLNLIGSNVNLWIGDHFVFPYYKHSIYQMMYLDKYIIDYKEIEKNSKDLNKLNEKIIFFIFIFLLIRIYKFRSNNKSDGIIKK